MISPLLAAEALSATTGSSQSTNWFPEILSKFWFPGWLCWWRTWRMVGSTLSRKLTILRRKSPRSRSKIPSGTFYPTQRVFQQRSRLMPLLYSIPFSKDYLQHGFNKSGMPRPHVQCTQTASASLQLASAAGRAETCHRFDTVFVFYIDIVVRMFK